MSYELNIKLCVRQFARRLQCVVTFSIVCVYTYDDAIIGETHHTSDKLELLHAESTPFKIKNIVLKEFVYCMFTCNWCMLVTGFPLELCK